MPQARKAAAKNGKPPHILSVEDIDNASDIKEEIVEVSEWGGAVKVRGLTRDETRELFAEIASNVVADEDGNLPIANQMDYQVALIVRGAIEPELTAEVLGRRAQSGVKQLSDEIAVLSGLSDEAAEAAEKDFS